MTTLLSSIKYDGIPTHVKDAILLEVDLQISSGLCPERYRKLRAESLAANYYRDHVSLRLLGEKYYKEPLHISLDEVVAPEAFLSRYSVQPSSYSLDILSFLPKIEHKLLSADKYEFRHLKSIIQHSLKDLPDDVIISLSSLLSNVSLQRSHKS